MHFATLVIARVHVRSMMLINTTLYEWHLVGDVLPDRLEPVVDEVVN